MQIIINQHSPLSRHWSKKRIVSSKDNKKNEQSISILTYPNPVSTELRVTIPTNWQGKKVSYELLNSNGQVMLSNITVTGSQIESMNVNSLAPGFYIVKVSCNGETSHQKIIKRSSPLSSSILLWGLSQKHASIK
jgi:hypothetical protein